MPKRESYVSGTPSWVELQTTDQGAAKSFYGGLFGWTYDDMPIDPANNVMYSIAQVNDGDVGAIAPPMDSQSGPAIPPHWGTYVLVDDIDATAAKVAPAGGTLIAGPFDVMEAGRMAVVADPTGAMINFWQAGTRVGATVVNEAGAFSWSELITPDVTKAGEFYTAVFGWGVDAKGAPHYTEFTVDGNSIAGAMNPPMPGIPTFWGVYFATDDTDATAAKAAELGGSVMQPPTDIEPGRFAVLVDPQGAVFNVIKMNQA